jgi:hypothetical protein
MSIRVYVQDDLPLIRRQAWSRLFGTCIEPGSLAPVIRNLVGGGLLTRSEGNKRRRRTMTITKAGEGLLVDEWANSLDAHREIESVLRGVTVALLMGDVATPVGFLFRSAEERTRYQGPQQLERIPSGMAPVDFHAEIRAVHENRRRATEAAVLREFGTKLVKSGQNLDLNQNRGIRSPQTPRIF